MFSILTGMLDAALSVAILGNVIGGAVTTSQTEKSNFRDSEAYAQENAKQVASVHQFQPDYVEFEHGGHEYKEEYNG